MSDAKNGNGASGGGGLVMMVLDWRCLGWRECAALLLLHGQFGRDGLLRTPSAALMPLQGWRSRGGRRYRGPPWVA